MTIRVTQSIGFSAAQRNITRAYSRLFEAEQATSTGLRITKPSDDPGSIARLLGLKRRSAELDQYQSNAAEGRTFVQSGAANLQEISDLLSTAKERSIQGLTGTLAADEREIIAQQIDNILQDIVSLANSRIGDRFLFAGTDSNTQPFRTSTLPSGQDVVRYFGDDGQTSAEIGPGASTTISIPGSRVFLNSGESTPRLSGATGATLGTGASSGRGSGRLAVFHEQTAYSIPTLVPGQSSATGDTVIGAHSLDLAVDAGNGGGTVALNGGSPIRFTQPATDFEVTGPNGEVVFLNLSAVTTADSGSHSLLASGSLSLDGGTTRTAITFGNNQQLIDSASGIVLSVDSTAIRRTGTDVIHFEGSLDIFSTLIALRDGLRTAGDQGDLSGDLENLRSILSELDGSQSRLLRALGELGTTDNRLEAAEFRLLDLDARVIELISSEEEVDISQAAIELFQSRTAYQGALAITGQVNQLSLLDFL